MPKYKVVISDHYYENLAQEEELMQKLDAQLLAYHYQTAGDVLEAARDCDVLICEWAPITRQVIEGLTRCRGIVRYAIGVDNIDVAAATERGIPVCNVPDYCLDEVSNQTIALLLDCARKLTFSANMLKQGVSSYTALKPLHRLAGQTLGLMGFGHIPQLVARKLAGFGLRLITYDPYLPEEAVRRLGVTPVSFDELLGQSDYLSLHCPLTGETRHLFNEGTLRRMKKTSVLLNTARGAIVDTNDLVRALQEGTIAMAGLDVTEEEPLPADALLLKLPNAVVTPHLAWYSEEAIRSLQLGVAQETARLLQGEPPLHVVNKLGLRGRSL